MRARPDDLTKQERTLLTDLRKLDVERNIRTEELKQAEGDAEQAQQDLGTLGNEIDALESQDAAERPKLEARMVELYKLGSAGYVRMLLNVADLKEFGRAYRMVSALAEIGEPVRARELAERMLAYAGPLDLFAENIDPHTGRHLGNYPNAFTHLAMVNALLHVIALDDPTVRVASR